MADNRPSLRVGSLPRSFVVVLALAVGILGLPSTVGAETEPSADEQQVVEAPIVIETVDGDVDPTDDELIAALTDVHNDFEAGTTKRVGQPILSFPSAAALSGGFSVSFDATHTAPSNVQALVIAAAEAWDAVLATSASGPVEIAVIWRNLGGASILGSAGPNGLYSHSSLPTSSFYPVGLANTLLSTDLNGSQPELVVNLNSTPNWYVGTTGSPGPGETDLYSVVLHEIGHGLGFLGSASTSNDPGPTPTLSNPRFVYDELVNAGSVDLLSTSNPNSHLTTNNLTIDLNTSLAAKIFDPASWQEGSSFSHLDEASFPAGTAGSLMTPTLITGELERVIDSPVLGVMAGLRWPMRVGLVTPTITSVVPSGSQVAVTWTRNLETSGLPPDGYRIEAWRGAILDATASVSSSATTVTLSNIQNGVQYTLKVVPYSPAGDGPPATTVFSSSLTPSKPGIVTASGAGLAQTISWTVAPGAGVTGYEVERSTDGVSWIPLGTTGGLSFTTAVAHGVHQFRVRAINGYGPGPWGYTIPAGVSATVDRPVPLDGQIARLYEAYFLREPDAGGFAHWQGERAKGSSLGSISGVFAASAEIQAAYGSLTDTQFVELVYQNVLGRPADAGGRSHWVGQLANGTSRGEVMIGFSESNEYISQTGTVGPTSEAEAKVYRLYVAFFLRFPDAGGLQYWTSVRAGGASLESIAASFAASAEFQAAYGSLSNSAFVQLVYNNVLGRTADAAGGSYWEGQLAAGLNRGAMMVGFSESSELVIATGTIP